MVLLTTRQFQHERRHRDEFLRFLPLGFAADGYCALTGVDHSHGGLRMEPRAKILLVGSHATLMGAIAARLEYEHHCTVVGVVSDPAQAVGVLANRPVDIALVDMDEGGADRLGGVEVLRTVLPNVRIILISTAIDDRRIEQALKAGVNGLLAKDEVPATIAKAIHEVLAGGAHFPDGIRSRIVLDPRGLRLAESTTDGEDNHEPE